MSINTDSSAGKAVANRLGLNKKTKHVQLRYLYMQDIVQRGEMTISKIPTTDNPANVLTKHLPATTIISHLERLHLQAVGSLLGVPTTTRLTIRMINVVNNEQQPTTPATEARLGLHLSQAQQFRRKRRRRNSQDTPRRRSLTRRGDINNNYLNNNLNIMQFNNAIHNFGSKISPLATASQFVADIGSMAGNTPIVLTVEANGDMTLPCITLSRTCLVTVSTGGSTIPETINEEVLGYDTEQRQAMNSLGVTPEDVEQGRQAAMAEHRRVTLETNRRIRQATEDNDVNTDSDVNMDGRPTVTTIPASTETSLPRASSHSSIDSDSTIDRSQIDVVEQMMWKLVASPQCNPFLLDRLHRSHYMETMPLSYYKSST
eukprot:1242374-Amphidinium_carterae.1